MFSGKRVRQAREIRRLTQKQLAERIGKTQGSITHIERGFKDASAELIAAIAQVTDFPMSFFTTEPRIEFPLDSLLFRARAAMTRRDAVAACHYAEIVYEMVEMLSEYVTQLPVVALKSQGHPAEAAREVRRKLRIPPDLPIPHLINGMERAGVTIIALPLNVEGIDAFSCWIEDKPVVAVCAGRSGDRTRWNAAHELGHLAIHANRKIRAEEHRQADEFAAELLLPEVQLRKEIMPPVTIASLAQLKPRWGVAIQALIRRAHDLKIITDRQYTYLFEQLSVRGWRTKEPENLDLPIEKPQGLRRMIELSPFANNPARLAAELRVNAGNLTEVLSVYDDLSSLSHSEDRTGKVIPMRK